MLTRREFLTRATVTLALTPIIASCSSSGGGYGGSSTSTNPTEPACDGIGETSTATQGHTHTICVAASDLASPPAAGATYTTSSTQGHTHDVMLTQAQLTAIEAGQSATVTTTNSQGHTHDFMITKTSSPAPAPPPSGGSRGGY